MSYIISPIVPTAISISVGKTIHDEYTNESCLHFGNGTWDIVNIIQSSAPKYKFVCWNNFHKHKQRHSVISHVRICLTIHDVTAAAAATKQRMMYVPSFVIFATHSLPRLMHHYYYCVKLYVFSVAAPPVYFVFHISRRKRRRKKKKNDGKSASTKSKKKPNYVYFALCETSKWKEKSEMKMRLSHARVCEIVSSLAYSYS